MVFLNMGCGTLCCKKGPNESGDVKSKAEYAATKIEEEFDHWASMAMEVKCHPHAEKLTTL